MFIIYNEAIEKAMRDDPYIPPPDALTLTATEDNSSVALIKNGTLDNTYEVNTGNGWEDYDFNTVIPLNAGQSCKWRCKSHPTTQTYSDYVQFVMTGKIEASGSCSSMLSSDFENITSLSGYDYAFFRLFSWCTSLTQAPELPATTLTNYCYSGMFEECSSLTQAPALPATTLTNYCYSGMFDECSSLTQAPALPATTLTNSCYRYMFSGCTSLTQAPELPATTLAESCYYYMFSGCTSLTQAPQVPATTLTNSCYENMFKGCISLTQAPALPATTLTNSCYSNMFYGCTSLEQAPELPATTLTSSCYRYMFYGCSKLKEVRISATATATTPATSTLDSWLSGVATTGNFYCDPNATIFQTGVSGIPEGWSRLPLS